ncbi:Rho termination factor N-terminal domain-containing protein [Pseudomonas sp. Marseille-QA0892]
MPRGDKSKYTEKQQRKAEHIEESYEQRGVSSGEAEARAWATVNKQSGGGERKGGSGQQKSGGQKQRDRKDSAQRAVATKEGHSPNKGSARSSGGSPKRSGGNSLESLTVTELKERAAKKGISGRSKMRKQELVDALRAA